MNTEHVIVENLTKKFKLKKPKGFFTTIKLKKYYSDDYLIALDNITFSIKQGEALGIIGLNGSGKSTLLKTIAGIYTPTSGKIEVNGTMAPLMQIGGGFQGDLDPGENIVMYGMLLGMNKSKIESRVEEILDYAELKKFSTMKLKYFSAGMRARLSFATAMQVDCDVMLIDEVLAVGDRLFKEKSYETFLSLKKNKKTILHATHNLDKLLEFSDRILLLHKGKTVSLGKPEEVIDEYKKIKTAK